MSVILLPPAPQIAIPTDRAKREGLIRALGFQVDDERLKPLVEAAYVLVRNDGPEKWRCINCNVRHDHYTVTCIPKPWRGLEHALYGYWVNVGATHERDLAPAQRARLAKLAPIFGRGRPVTPLAQSDPETAHALATSERDIVQGATVLGSLDPITVEKARFYADLIRSRGGQVRL